MLAGFAFGIGSARTQILFRHYYWDR